MNEYFLIWPMTDEPAEESAEEEKRLKDLNRLHPNCEHFQDLALSKTGVDLSDFAPGKVRLSFLSYLPFCLIHKDLQMVLEPEFSRRFSMFPVRLRGHRLDDWLIYHDNKPVTLRGNKNSYCYRCQGCGKIIYTPMGNRYLLQNCLPESSIAGAENGGFVLDESLTQKLLQSGRWPKVAVQSIKIRTNPIDGFPVNLNEISADQERRVKLG